MEVLTDIEKLEKQEEEHRCKAYELVDLLMNPCVHVEWNEYTKKLLDEISKVQWINVQIDRLESDDPYLE